MNVLIVDSDATAATALELHCREILGARLARLVVHLAPLETDPPVVAPFDVVLLDPQVGPLEQLDQLVRRLDAASRTIIVSARTELALPAFECGVLDFVPKPVNRERLAKALQRAEPRHAEGEAAEKFLAVRRSGRIDLVALDDLLYVEGADKYSELVFANGRRNFHDTALGRLEATLPQSFVRIHKSFLVRFTMVSRLHVLKGSRYFAELKNGLRLPVGRSHYEQVKSRLLWPQRRRR
jgi:DNA-binding LytR/AlgR family response regulator